MSVFQTQTASAAAAALDPNKHVRFSLGMVLGADDLEQEFAYVANLPQWLARETIGYGTVCGLRVSIDMDSDGPRITVDPGVAVTPRGQLVRVTPAQCAYINAWLDSNREEVNRQIGSPLAGGLTLYVILCYRACPTDSVPIPGEPCRDETEAMVDSRWQDDFELKLALRPPEQTEEDGVRSFVSWLSQIPITDEPTSFANREEFLNLLRESAPMLEAPWGSPPISPPGSPPDTHHINTADACDYLRAAFRIWVTELRPRWRGYLHYTVRGGDRLATIAAKFNISEVFLAELNLVSDDTLEAGQVLNIPKMFCDGTPPDEECLLLAELDVPLVGGRADVMSSENIHEERRPYLIHLRLLQEWLLCGRTGTTDASMVELSGDVVGMSNNNTVIKIQNTDVSPTAPNENQLLTYLDGQWQPADPEPVAMPDLGGDVTGPGDNNTVVRIRNVEVASAMPAEDQVLTFRSRQWQPADPPAVVTPNLNGDVTGAADANTVVKLQHVNVAATLPGPGQVLTFDAGLSQWMPRDPTAGPVTGDFVEHPKGLPRYFIVAAGIVRGDGTNLFLTYNGLIAQDLGGGDLLVTFDGYSDPNPDNGTSLYIIKAMPVFNPDFGLLTVNFLHFKEGIHLMVMQDRQPAERLADIEFVIEVSQYFFDQGLGPELLNRAVADRPPVNLNSATVDELRTLPRIGPELANRIVQARKKNRGGFKSLRDLLKVEGIGEDLLRVIEPFVTISRT